MSESPVIRKAVSHGIQSNYLPNEFSTSEPRVQEQFENLTEENVGNQTMESSENQFLIETVKEIGDGMHAKIYLAHKKTLNQKTSEVEVEKICVKVFKPVQDVELMGCAEEEYRVS